MHCELCMHIRSTKKAKTFNYPMLYVLRSVSFSKTFCKKQNVTGQTGRSSFILLIFVELITLIFFTYLSYFLLLSYQNKSRWGTRKCSG